MTEAPRPPAQIEPIVRALGVDDAVTFLMTFGGAEIYMARAPGARSRLVEVLGRDKAEALARAAEEAPHWPRRVPLAKQWLSHVLRAKGLPNAEIARRLRVSEETVRRLLSFEPRAAAQDDPRQPRLF